MSVDILITTYNAERYLLNQLLSLQQHSYVEWTLWVHDEGSILRKSDEFDCFGYQMDGTSCMNGLVLNRIGEYRSKSCALS